MIDRLEPAVLSAAESPDTDVGVVGPGVVPKTTGPLFEDFGTRT